MRKFSGPMGSVSRVTSRAKPSRAICWGIRRCASSTCLSRLGMTERDCPCLWTLSASRAAACRGTTCATRASRRRPRCRAGHDSVRNRGGKARDTDERFHANPICRRNSRGARPACHQHGHRSGRQKNREGRQSEVDRNNDMGCQSTRGCSHNDAHLRLNTQVLASITAKTEPRREIIEIASLTRGNTKAVSPLPPCSCTFPHPECVTARLTRCNANRSRARSTSRLGGSVGRRKEVGCG
jgi:hypothetical protein